MKITSSLLNEPIMSSVKKSLIKISLIDNKEKFRTRLIEYIDDTSDNETDGFFWEMISNIQFLHPNDSAVAYTTPDKLIYMNSPGIVGEHVRFWDFIYCHECLHQLWDTFGVAEQIKKNGIKYNHEILNIASDCVINDYLSNRKKKDMPMPDSLISAELLKKKYGVEYDDTKDTQFTLYMKLMEKEKELQNDQTIKKNKVKFPGKIKPKSVTVKDDDDPPPKPPKGDPPSPDFIKGWTDAINDVLSGKVDPLNMNKGVSESFKYLIESTGDYDAGYNAAINQIAQGLIEGVTLNKSKNKSNDTPPDNGGLPPIPWDLPPTGGSGSDGDPDDSTNQNDNDEENDEKNDDLDANDARQDAEEAQKNANEAQKDAATAKAAAEHGKCSKKDAKMAQDAADKAQAAADKAKDAAQRAADAANSGDTNAEKEAAKEARDAANDASNSAIEANNAAKNANNTAESAKQSANEADNIKDELNELSETVDELQRTGDISSKEAKQIKDTIKEAQKAADNVKAAAKRSQDAANKGDAEGETTAAKEAKDALNKAKGLTSYSKSLASNAIGGLTPEEIEKRTKHAEDCIKRYKETISGAFGEFIKKCKSSVKCDPSGLSTGVQKGKGSWNKQLDSSINARVKKEVDKFRRQYERTYKRIKRGTGVVKMGQPIIQGKRVKQNKMPINIAFYVDTSGSMQGSINDVYDAVFNIATGLTQKFGKNKFVESIDFRLIVFDTRFEEKKFGSRVFLGGGTMDFDELMEGIEQRTKNYLINIIITDGEFGVNQTKAKQYLNALDGLVIYIANNEKAGNKVVKRIADENAYKTKLHFILADSNFTVE